MRTPLVVCSGLGIAALAAAVLWFPSAPAPFAAAEGEGPVVRLVDAFPGEPRFTRPLFAVQPPDGTARIFVVEQAGAVYVLDHPYTDESPQRKLFIDIGGQMGPRGNEEGLLGFAFHPDYASNGRFFVHYSASSPRRNVLAECRVSAGDPDRAAAGTLTDILEIPQPFNNHNGGMIAFGPDGYLYLAIGDGGSAGDPLEFGQDLRSLHGSILRLDVDDPPEGETYRIPADNPFVDRPGARGEIWAYGLRNPWRFSFDRQTGDLWLGDVGQNTYEEIDLVVKGGNYGWDRREGFNDFEPEPTPPADPLIDPLASYGRADGRSVTGGYVYRGSAVPELFGAYIYGDYVSGRIFRLCVKDGVTGPPRSSADVTVDVLLDAGRTLPSFAEDRAGELYICTFEGRVLRLEAGPPPVDPPPDEPPAEELPLRLSELGLFADMKRLRPVDGALRYKVNAPLWSDGASKQRFLVLPEATSMQFAFDGAFDVPVGTYAVKTFTLPGRGRARRLETRVILRTDEGFEVGTYRWNTSRTEALLLSGHVDEEVPSRRGPRTWPFPSPAECRSCHLPAAGFLLGVTARQLRAETLSDWVASGALDGPVPGPTAYERNVSLRRSRGLERKVRSYLDANCAFCHRPDAPEAAGLDLRGGTDLAATGILDTVPREDLGIPGARVVAPGDPDRSVLLERMQVRGSFEQMPTIGTHRVDRRAVRTLRRWIRRLNRPR